MLIYNSIFNIQQNLSFPPQNWESGLCLGFCKEEQDSKELSPRPLANAPKIFNSKKFFKLLMLKGSLTF